MKPLVSVLTTTHNHENYIGSCVDSIMNQTFNDWEMIVLDDGSTDATAEVAADLAAQDSRIHLLRQANRGIWRLGENYNRALKHCRGEYIAILEGDDYAMPRRLELQLASFKPSTVLSYGKAVIVNEKHEPLQLRPRNIKLHSGFVRRKAALGFIVYGDFIMSLTVMIRKRVLDLIGGFKSRAYYVDFPTWTSLLRYGDFAFVDEVLSYWILHRDNATLTMRKYMAHTWADRLKFLTTDFPRAMLRGSTAW